jgi:hypothetical protein
MFIATNTTPPQAPFEGAENNSTFTTPDSIRSFERSQTRLYLTFYRHLTPTGETSSSYIRKTSNEAQSLPNMDFSVDSSLPIYFSNSFSLIQ